MSGTFTEIITLEKITCGGCGITFAVPEDWIAAKRREAGSFHCPNGCCRGWRESEADKLKKQLEATARELRESKFRELAEKQLREATEAREQIALRKLKRVRNGVCPCCKRSFTNLRRHIACKHPEFQK